MYSALYYISLLGSQAIQEAVRDWLALLNVMLPVPTCILQITRSGLYLPLMLLMLQLPRPARRVTTCSLAVILSLFSAKLALISDPVVLW